MEHYASPTEVLAALRDDLSLRSKSVRQAAAQLGFKSPQSLYNMFSLDKYPAPVQAERLHRVFGYSYDYLVRGEGALLPGVPAHTSSEEELFMAKKQIRGLSYIVRATGSMDAVEAMYALLMDNGDRFFTITDRMIAASGQASGELAAMRHEVEIDFEEK